MNRLAKYLLMAIAATIVATGNVMAQKKKQNKTAAPTYTKPRTELIDSLMREYRFDEAKDIIKEDITLATNAGVPTKDLRDLENRTSLGEQMIEATEKVIVIDSFVIDREQILATISLDDNCGKILTAKQIKDELKLAQLPQAFGFVNNFKDNIIYSQQVGAGATILMSSNLFGDNWGKPIPLEGLVDSSAVSAYPFLLSDGTTLYFASKNANSLGGFDIFNTRYNSETKTFLRPENVGMPFNSPANDYMMAFDEVNNLGWFVSDRNQPADKVCVYVFIPTETRETYEDADEDELRNLAALNSIKATQKGFEKQVAEAKERLSNSKNGKKSAAVTDNFHFDVAYGIHYTSIEQFKNVNARKMASELQMQYAKREQLKNLLKENRVKYGNCKSATEKKTLEPMILRQETELDNLNKQIFDLENNIRKNEK